MMHAVFLKCGHVSNSFKADGTPCCSLCRNLNDVWDQPATELPILSGRTAVCRVCWQATANSELTLTDFRYCGENSFLATQTCKCGHSKHLHRFGGYYPAERHGRRRHTKEKIKGICINEGGRWQENGPYESDLFYCGCLED